MRERTGLVVALALYVAGSLVATWPLALRLNTHLPLGELDAPTVPWLNLWTLCWNAASIARGYAGYWDAPIFHPARGALAMSEPLGLQGVVFAPLSALFGAVAAYDLVLLLALVANAMAARRLLRTLGLDSAVATAGGAIALLLPFVLKELGVLQLTLIAPSLLALTELVHLMRGPDRAAVWRLAASCVLTVYACGYYALLLAPLLLLAVPFVLRRALGSRRFVLTLAAAVMAASAAVAPLVIAQHVAVGELHRSAEAVRHGSASGYAYLRAPRRSLAAHVVPALRARGQARALYPGLGLLLLALFGTLHAVRARPTPRDGRFYGYCAVGTTLAVLLSFGSKLHIGSFHPYVSLVQAHLPGYAQLRNPYRFAALAQALACVLAAFGLQALVERWPRQRLLVPLLTLCVVAETLPLGVPLRRFPTQALQAPWVRFLARHSGGAVAMVPPQRSGKARDYAPITLAMLQGLQHGHPLVNGYSGFFPRASDRVVGKSWHFPSRSALKALSDAGVRWVVADNAWLAQQGRTGAARAAGLDALRVAYVSPDRNVYEITFAAGRRPRGGL